MKTLSFLGSPRRNGNTAALLDSVIKGMESAGSTGNEYIFLQEKNIKPCRGCESCKREGATGCVQKDDMQDIYPLIASSDILIFASPIYWWSVTAQVKLLVDRLYAMNFTCPGKRIVLLMTYGGELPNSGVEITERQFRDICEYVRMEAAAVLGVCTGSVEVKDNPGALAEAFDLGRMLAAG